MFYSIIVEAGLDPANCNLAVVEDLIAIEHNSGSRFAAVLETRPGAMFGVTRRGTTFRPRESIFKVRANVADGTDKLCGNVKGELNKLLPLVKEWAYEVKNVVETPDYWAEARRNSEFIAGIQDEDSGNRPFSKEEQDEIIAQLQAVKKFVAKQFELPSEQMAHIEERLDDAAEASKRMGRKDWLLLFSGTIFNLIVTDTVTPGVAQHIFTMAIQGLGHLFTGGSVPPQILA